MSKNTSPSSGMPLTLEQANELIYKLLERIAELEDRLNQHSGNSSKPPSNELEKSVKEHEIEIRAAWVEHFG